MLSLCREIGMPQEITDKLALTDTALMVQYVETLLSAETTEEVTKINDLLGDDPGGIKMLALQLTAALRTREIYAQKGIDDRIFISTAKSYTRYVNEHLVEFGHYGFDRYWWTWRIIPLKLFRLGVLEFEPEFKNGKDILSVHIPSDAVMTREGLDTSYKWAVKFFNDHFNDYKYEGIYCETWLLNPVIRDMLPEGSKILNFMADYKILSTDPESQDFMTLIFKRKYPDTASLPEDTSLQRAVKKHLLAGGKVGNGLGRYRHSIVLTKN